MFNNWLGWLLGHPVPEPAPEPEYDWTQHGLSEAVGTEEEEQVASPRYGDAVLEPPGATVAHDPWNHYITLEDLSTVPIPFANAPPRSQLVAANGHTYERVLYPGPTGEPLYRKRG